MQNSLLSSAPASERARYQVCSIAIHAAIVPLLLIGFANPAVRKTLVHRIELIDPAPLRPLVARPAAGGGGGERELLPVTKGRLPKAAKAFVPPLLTDRVPLLAMTPSIVAPPDMALPQSDLNNWGDPLAKLVNGSAGTGKSAGMGDSSGHSVGPGTGNSYGNGLDTTGVFSTGGGVSAPSVVLKVDPEYSEEARKAKYSGTVLLSVVVDPEGQAREIRIEKSLGMGLDERAIEAVRKWKFRAGRKDGRAVSVRARIEVNFRLL